MRRFEPVAGLGGIALAVSLFLPWYEDATVVQNNLAEPLVVFRALDPPNSAFEWRTGAWVALAGTLIAWIGSWMSMRDESTPGIKAPHIPRRPAPA